ncbi:conserved Plasmodium protein, unknown function [Plasmodium knowlesi strain H]|uniref:Uncharacterized protein n=3 Tax=Plasmodium knowlesi TaxID=5850 RepID=A0A5K1U546_PLAKH|nr:conserved Plasmodium protein, unknown function [Plasmodium knowlesi strain H]OTN64355.1 Uncharacterized protein PKNOH_S130214700 [Plasmodium knowlesi]CAA9989307.1 conserved Plasmodium protein, unknown function [Plasmodium knowlesi strain H]SBO26118.1 conserved Plasmodium protein, unknown function [Plasmodium knowlesi strain H]SBO26780.1 conserved Plasmodium protein, unknown function [Plasmodium knowlesi strain H]VVS78781.1 conserved Plasmodium protein, unknown function [Plasmodium knowlesi |eukprot:XP_002261654.1 hypothetical protein, conserved in Plasmodium species [Plasmodium knowlesi strain H]
MSKFVSPGSYMPNGEILAETGTNVTVDIDKAADFGRLKLGDMNGEGINPDAALFQHGPENPGGIITNWEEQRTRGSRRISRKLVDISILKNVLNVYSLFDRDNVGHINKKYACHVIQMIYKNDAKFMVENFKLNGEDAVGENEQRGKFCAKLDALKGQAFFCTKSFATLLLMLLREVFALQPVGEFITKEDFIDVVTQFVQTSTQDKNRHMYGMMKYPQNMITKFYSYVHYLKEVDSERKRKEIKTKKKTKELKSILFLDDQLVNADLDTHIKHFNEKTRKKLHNIKIENDAREMEECTFSPKIAKKPLYLLNRKFETKMKKLYEGEINIAGKNTPIGITYDIDDSIERTLHLPERVSFKSYYAPFTRNFSDLQHLHDECNAQPQIQLKYIIHQGYMRPKKIHWNDTLRNKRVVSLGEIDEDLVHSRENVMQKVIKGGEPHV